MEFFKAEKLTPTTTWIVDQTQVYCYLWRGGTGPPSLTRAPALEI